METLLPRGHRLALASGLGLVLLAAAPASAHVEVEAEGAAQAGTGPVTLAFTGESESTSAGVAGLKTQLPTGIAPANVSLASGPDGWALSPTADGFDVTGPALPVGEDSQFRITIAQLPADRTELVFPTIQRYSDGSEDAWIEPIISGSPEPDKPAPHITVAAAPAAAATAPPTSATATSATAAGSPPASLDPHTDAASQNVDESTTGTVVLVVLIVAGLALLGGGFWLLRRRRA